MDCMKVFYETLNYDLKYGINLFHDLVFLPLLYHNDIFTLINLILFDQNKFSVAHNANSDPDIQIFP